MFSNVEVGRKFWYEFLMDISHWRPCYKIAFRFLMEHNDITSVV
jgi:hypothetical protein